MPVSTLDPDVLRRMREVVATAIATRSRSLAEAAGEARGLGRGLQPALPAGMIDDAVTDLLKSFGVYRPPPDPVEVDGAHLLQADPAEVADALAHAMRFDERGKVQRTGHEYASKLAAEQLVRRLQASGFVVLRRRPPPLHSIS